MTNSHSAPGLYPYFSVQPRNIFYHGHPRWYPTTHYISASTRDVTNVDVDGNAIPRVLRAGLVLGKMSGSPNYYTNAFAGITTANAASGDTTLAVGTANATQIAAAKAAAGGGNYTITLAGPPTAGGTSANQTVTVTNVDAPNGNLTTQALSAAAVKGSILLTPGVGLPSQFVYNQYGVATLDVAGNSIDQTQGLLRDGDINCLNIVGYAQMDAGTKTWLKNAFRSGNPGAVLTFSDDR